MAEQNPCDRCEGGTVYNDEGYPDYPARTRCEHCAGTGNLVTFSHTCGAKSTFADVSYLQGSTFDCPCGLVLVIDGGEAINLYERMAANIRREYGVEVNPAGFGYVQL